MELVPACLDPDDTNTVFISTNADPVTGEPLVSRADRRRHYEIFQGVTTDGGGNWTWTSITSDSAVDNPRPCFGCEAQCGPIPTTT